MGRPRKDRADTIAGAQAAFAAVQRNADPPQRLGKKALVYWEAIYERRAADEWNKLDLLKACQLAKLYVERDVDHRKVRRDGGSVYTGQGKVKADGTAAPSMVFKRNPRDVVLVQRENLIMRIEKHLRLHAYADHKDTSMIRGQRQAEAAARAALEAAGPHEPAPAGDDLLPLFNTARPSRPQ
jgi:hypothetical protein